MKISMILKNNLIIILKYILINDKVKYLFDKYLNFNKAIKLIVNKFLNCL